MIHGTVTQANEAILPLEVRGPTGKSMVVDALLDTGCSDALTLLPANVQGLGLPFKGIEEVILADGACVTMEVYDAVVVWDGAPRDVCVLASQGGALLGMALLAGHRVMIDACENGPVLIQPLQASP